MQYFKTSLITLIAVVALVAPATNASSVMVSIDPSTLFSASSQPNLSGQALGIKKIKVSIRKEGSSKVIYSKSSIKVKDGKWSVNISKKLSEGRYEVDVSGIKGILTVGGTTFEVSSVPLLSGGVAQIGSTVPIAYLKIVNTGKTPGTLKGFSLRQNGSAPISVVNGFETVDGKGEIRRLSTDVNFVSTDATFAPGEMKLFTIKATLSNTSANNLGKDLRFDVIGIRGDIKATNSFPILGTTWIIGNK